MLQLCREVPVVATNTEAAQHVVVIERGDIESPEILIVYRQALIVGGPVRQVAVRNEVPVGIVPYPGDAVHGGCDRVVALRDGGRGLGHVPAHRHLERRLAVAEQIEYRAAPRIQVLPCRSARHRSKVSRRYPAVGRGVDVLGRDVPVEVVVPEAVIERQAPDGPLILEVDAQIPVAVLSEIRRRILGDLIRDAVVEPVIHVAVRFRAEILDALLELESRLEVVGPGDVGH